LFLELQTLVCCFGVVEKNVHTEDETQTLLVLLCFHCALNQKVSNIGRHVREATLMMNIHKGQKKACLNKTSLRDCWEK